jgi:hypothetical protein
MRAENRAVLSLVELAVAMMIMSAVLALTVTGMVHVLNPTAQTAAIGNTSTQLDMAFINLDQQVRYASAVWVPTQPDPAGNYEVLYEWTFDGSSNATCSQLEADYTDGYLRQRTWSATSPPVSAPGWHIWATNIVPNTPAGDPFSVPAQGYNKQQLTVTLTAASGMGQAHTTSQSSVTFTALDTTTAAAPTTTTCNATWT